MDCPCSAESVAGCGMDRGFHGDRDTTIHETMDVGNRGIMDFWLQPKLEGGVRSDRSSRLRRIGHQRSRAARCGLTIAWNHGSVAPCYHGCHVAWFHVNIRPGPSFLALLSTQARRAAHGCRVPWIQGSQSGGDWAGSSTSDLSAQPSVARRCEEADCVMDRSIHGAMEP